MRALRVSFKGTVHDVSVPDDLPEFTGQKFLDLIKRKLQLAHNGRLRLVHKGRLIERLDSASFAACWSEMPDGDKIAVVIFPICLETCD